MLLLLCCAGGASTIDASYMDKSDSVFLCCEGAVDDSAKGCPSNVDLLHAVAELNEGLVSNIKPLFSLRTQLE